MLEETLSIAYLFMEHILFFLPEFSQQSQPMAFSLATCLEKVFENRLWKVEAMIWQPAGIQLT